MRAVSEFRGRPLPAPASPTGYAALIERFNLPVPLPSRLTAVASRTRPLVTSSWRLLTPRDRPVESVAGHLAFALACEDLNLDVLAAVFQVTTREEIAARSRIDPEEAVSVLLQTRRAIAVNIGGQQRVLPVEYAGR